MTFDYKLRGGRATRSNALALMTAVGLEIGVKPEQVRDVNPPR